MTTYTYTNSPSLNPLKNLSPQTLISATKSPPIVHLMTSTLVLRQRGTKSQILLLRRSPTDSFPLRWEPPGGSVDEMDGSIVDAAAREVFEESSLVNVCFYDVVNWEGDVEIGKEKVGSVEVRIGEDVVRLMTFLETGNVWGKVNFVAKAEGEVVIDPEEHVEWGWFTEEQVFRGRAAWPFDHGAGVDEEEKEVEERVLEFTTQTVWRTVLEAFRIGRELGVIV